MPNQLNLNPDFTGEEGQPVGEVKPEEGKPLETELPPQEKPAEEVEPVGEQEAVKPEGEPISQDSGEDLKKQISGLEWEKNKLLEDITSLRGQRRELKQEQLDKVDSQLIKAKDEFTDLYPEDVQTFDKIAKAKGLVSRTEVEKIVNSNVRQQVLDAFLDKYPEYKPENDPDDKKWTVLQKEMSFYRPPENPRGYGPLLERARKATIPPSYGEPSQPDIQRRIKTASIGTTGGSIGSSSSGSLTSEQKEVYRRGGWTEEEIKEIEKNLK